MIHEHRFISIMLTACCQVLETLEKCSKLEMRSVAHTDESFLERCHYTVSHENLYDES